MSTTWLTNEKKSVFKCSSFHFLGLLIVISYATAIEYGTYRRDVIFEGPGGHRRATTTRIILEQLNNRSLTTHPNLQDATEHLLQYGALLRVQILDTFGKLVYDKYDDFGMSQIESLYRIYHDTLERKYNIFDIVPSVLYDGDTRPTKICQHINKYVHTCLKESSYRCAKINIHDKPHENHTKQPALSITRKLYQLAQIPKSYPEGFSLHGVLQHLRAGRLHLTPALFSGLLHNVQYDNFDDKVRRSERELVKYLNTAPNTWKIPNQSLVVSTKVSELLKNYLTAGSKFFPRKAAKQAAYLSKHVVREIDAVSKNIELLGIVYDNSTINLEYLFNLVLPKDVIDRDVLEARDYLVRTIKTKRIVERYLSIDKYQQYAPDQLVLDILGQLREIHFAEDLVASLYIHASYWHKSNMIENLEDLLELFDAYENLRTIKNHQKIFVIAEEIKHDLHKAKNVSIEISCSRPRECLRLGLQTLLNCVIIKEHTRRAIKSFIEVTTWGCSIQTNKVVNETLRQVVVHDSDESESVESIEILPQTTTESVKKVVLDYSESESSSSEEHEESHEIEASEESEDESSEEWSASIEQITERATTTTPKPVMKHTIEKSIEKVATVVNKTAKDRCRHNDAKCSEIICLNGICESNKIKKVEEVVEEESEQSESVEESASESHESIEQSEESEEESMEILEIPTTKKIELTTRPSIPTTTEIQRTTRRRNYIICNNNDPHHQRKLHRLRKVRFIDALRSKNLNPNVVDEVSVNKRSKPTSSMSSDFDRLDISEDSRNLIGRPKYPDTSKPDLELYGSHRRNALKTTSVIEELEKIRSQREKPRKTKLHLEESEETRPLSSNGMRTKSKLEELEETKLRGQIIREAKLKLANLRKTSLGRKNDQRTKSQIEELEEIITRMSKSVRSQKTLDSDETNTMFEHTSTQTKNPKNSRTISVKQTSWSSTNSEDRNPNVARLRETLMRTENGRSKRIMGTTQRPSLTTVKWSMTGYGKNNFGGKTSETRVSYDIENPVDVGNERKKFRKEEHVSWSSGPIVKKTVQSSRITSSNPDELSLKSGIRTRDSGGVNSRRTYIEELGPTGDMRKMLKANISYGIETPSKLMGGKNKVTKEQNTVWSTGPIAGKIVRSRQRFSYDTNKPSMDKYRLKNQGSTVLENSKRTSYGIKDSGGDHSKRVYMDQLGGSGGMKKSIESDISYDIENPVAELSGGKNKITREENVVWSSGPIVKNLVKSKRRYSYDTDDEPSGETNEIRRQHWKKSSYGIDDYGGDKSKKIHAKDGIYEDHQRSSKSSVSLRNPLQSGKEGKKFRREEHTIWSSGPIVKKTVESRQKISYGSEEPLGKSFEITNQGSEGLRHSKRTSYGIQDSGGQNSRRVYIEQLGQSGDIRKSLKFNDKNVISDDGPVVKKVIRSRSRYSYNTKDPSAVGGSHMSAGSNGDFSLIPGHKMVHESRRKIGITGNSGMASGSKTTRTRSRSSYRGSSRSGHEMNEEDYDPSRTVVRNTIVERPDTRRSVRVVGGQILH